MGTCYIVGAGDFSPRDLEPKDGDFVIAADGGLLPLLSLGVKPDLLIGDLDSLGGERLIPAEVPLRRLRPEKDDTDTAVSLQTAYDLGYRDFRLYGCSGGRADLLLSNYQLMGQYSRMGAGLWLVAPDYDAYALTNGTLVLPHRARGTTVSVFCHGERAEGVTLKGLKYPLDAYTLTCDRPLGVSNEHLDGAASVAVENGTLLIFQWLAPRQRA